MIRLLTRGAAALLLCTGSLAVAGDWIKPGLWEETVVIDTLGDGKKGDVDTKCWTPEKVAELSSSEATKASLMKSVNKDCTLKQYEHTATGLRYEVSCPDGAGMSGKIAVGSSTSMNTSGTMKFGTISGAQEKTSRWIAADCGEHADE